jgi:hypothetical protein
MNLALVEELVQGSGDAGVVARLDNRPGQCRVAIGPATRWRWKRRGGTAVDIALWIAQVLLALGMLAFGFVHATQRRPDNDARTA